MRRKETTYMVTSATEFRRRLFLVHANAQMLCDVLSETRDEGKYKLHAFVVMPDHFHALITPSPILPLERCVQFIKGRSSVRVAKGPIWQKGFNEQGAQGIEAYRAFVRYIEANPARRGLHDWPFVSSRMTLPLDAAPLSLAEDFSG